MTNSEKLFTYGTLQNKFIQKELFGRILNGIEDKIEGFTLSTIEFSENQSIKLYPILIHSDNPSEIVKGKVFELSKAEIIKADEYETYAYKRIKAKLKSGIKAWVYVKPKKLHLS